MTHRLRTWLGLLAVALCPLVHADVVLFNTDPFAGSTALTTPGRQVVGGEPSISFSIAGDQFVFDPAAFNFGNSLNFAGGLIGDLPSSGANALVLLSFDNDNDAATPFVWSALRRAGPLTLPRCSIGPSHFQGLDRQRLFLIGPAQTLGSLQSV